jgi:hypothetical protein
MTRKEVYIEKILEMYRSFPLNIQIRADLHLCLKKLPTLKEKTSENNRVNSAWHIGLPIMSVPSS